MKYRALKDTFDKETKEPIKKGDLISLSQKRADKALKRGLVEFVKTEKKEGKPNKSKKEKK